MTSFLEVIAADHSEQVTAGRKAVALASKRVNERFGRFLLGAEDRDNLEARIGYVQDDLNGVVTATCDEVGYPNSERLATQIVETFRNQEKFKPQQRTASFQFEARKPKMCPYHKEIVGISLAQGDPRAGFEAMAQHAFGEQHCDGAFEGTCNFRPEMTTQTWWDDRDKALQERREERERQREEEAQLQGEQEAEQLEQVDTDPIEQEPVSDSEAPAAESDPDLGVDTESPSEGLTEAPEGVDGVEAEVPMAMAASFRQLASRGDHREGASEHTSEALKTIDVEQRKGPVPTLDRRKWTVENLEQRIQTEGEGSPHPTRQKDVVEPITQKPDSPDNSKQLSEIGEGVTERQDVSKDSGPKPGNRRTWPTGERSAVSSTTPDVERNPVQDILESDFDGFVPQAVVERAVQR